MSEINNAITSFIRIKIHFNLKEQLFMIDVVELDQKLSIESSDVKAQSYIIQSQSQS